MRPLSRFLLATLAGLMLGAMVHLVAVLAMPDFSEKNAFSQLEMSVQGDDPGFISSPVNETALPWLRFADPATTLAVCPYDLTKGPFLISIEGDTSFQSISFHAHRGGVFFAVTNQAQVRGQTGFVLATEGQMSFMEQNGDYDEFYSQNIKVVAPSVRGLAVLRTLAPYPSFRKASEGIPALSLCRRLTAEDQQQEDENAISQDLLPPRRGGR